MANTINDGQTKWFVMRDLKRANAKLPVHRVLADMGVEVFVPMKRKIVTRGGKRVSAEVPFLQDLIFVHGSRIDIDPIVEKIATFQYRWLRGSYREPMTVPEKEMQRFIFAVRSVEQPRFYQPEEITPEMYGRKIRIIGGQLDGYEGSLITTRGSKVKRILVELPGLLAVGVEVDPDYIQLI